MKISRNRNIILFFDISNFEWLRFALVDPVGGAVKDQKIPLKHFDSESALPALLKFLKKNKISVVKKSGEKGAIAKIYFVSGPGSFSGIRIGAAIALGLQFVWKIPVFALKKSQIPKKFSARAFAGLKAKRVGLKINLDYGAKPRITKEKKKKLRNT